MIEVILMLNNVNLCGRLTHDIDLRYTNSGKAVGSFSLAVTLCTPIISARSDCVNPLSLRYFSSGVTISRWERSTEAWQSVKGYELKKIADALRVTIIIPSINQ